MFLPEFAAKRKKSCNESNESWAAVLFLVLPLMGDAERIELDAESVDGVLCRFG